MMHLVDDHPRTASLATPSLNVLGVESLPVLRRDIEWSRRGPSHRARWVARDPIACTYFYFNEIERRLLEQFDGRRSLGEIITWAQQNFPTYGWTLTSWNRFLARLEQASLLVASDRSTRIRYANRFKNEPSRWSWRHMGQLLAWRQPLGNPSSWLGYAAPLSRCLFAPSCIVLSLAISIVVWFLVMLRIWESPWSWYHLGELLQGNRLWGMLAAFLITKVIHELGHLLACQRLGVPCREVGIVWLFMTPLLYCDTSESWRLSRWYHRAGIAAAGMYVEWLLATLAAVAWLLLLPSGWQAMAANFMVVCSIGTLIVNANPLLRYDGYYILSDFAGVPNLADQSREVVREGISAWLTGDRLPQSRWDASPWKLASYGIASFIYRNVMLVGIIWALWKVLEPLGLGLLAVSLSLILLLGTVYGWFMFVRNIATRMSSSSQVRWLRGAMLLVCLACAAWFCVAYPLPNAIIARAMVRYPQSQPLFANADAECIAYLANGSHVNAGTVIADLRASSKALQRVQIASQCRVLEERLKLLQVLSVDDATAIAEQAIVNEQLAEQRTQLGIIERELRQLTLVATSEGVLVTATNLQATPLVDRDTRRDAIQQPVAWLTPERHGAAVPRGLQLGWVVAPQQVELHALVSDHDIDQVNLEPSVHEPHVICRLDGIPSQSIAGTLRRVVPEPVKETPDELIDDHRLISVRSAHGTMVPERPHYQVPIRLASGTPWIRPGSLATVRIETQPATLWERLCRFARNNLRW